MSSVREAFSPQTSMPAASDPAKGSLPALPVRFRPLGVRLAVMLFGGLLTVVALVIWFAFDAETRARFTAPQLVTIFALAGGAYACGYALSRSRVDARPEGLVVVNGYKTRRLEWSQVLGVSLKPGSPWVMLDLSDGTTVPAMGIQGSDGARATRQMRLLRALVEDNSRTLRND
jgi:hypothetical protein